MVYYITNTSNSNLNVNKLQLELRNHNFYISELSMLELYSHFRNDILKLKNILNYLHIHKYMVIPYLDNKHTIVNNKFNDLIGKDDFFLKCLADESLRVRIEIESKYLNFWSTCIATIYLAVYYKDEPINKQINKELSKSIIEAVLILNENHDIYSSNLWNILYDFYKDYDENKLKGKIVDHILNKCMVFTNLLYISYEGIDFWDFLENVNKYDEKLKGKIFLHIFEDRFAKKIEKRKMFENRLINNSFIQALEDNLKYFENTINITMNPTIVKYYKTLFKKFFTIDGMKIDKNNVIDSLLLSYYPNYHILTSDSCFLKFIEELDPNYHSIIINILEKCKKD